MKTNVIMKSADRNLFGIVIKQNTKNGQSLSVTDLMKAYEVARFQHGWGEKNITMIMNSQSFLERVYHILNERDMVKLSFLSFMEMIEREGVVKTLKGLGVWRTTGRAENKSTYADPYIWVLLAMELNPLIYAKVIIWLTDNLIFNRILAGTEFLPMNKAISMIIKEPLYPLYSIEINKKVFGFHEKGIRDFAMSEQLDKITEIEKFVTQLIEQGFIKDEEQLINAIKNYKFKQ